MIAIRGFLG